MKTKIATLSVLCASIALLTGQAQEEKKKGFRPKVVAKGAAERANADPLLKNAVCVVMPTEGNTCKGIVRFEAVGKKRDQKVKVSAKISGLAPNSKHAIHIHQFGDTTDFSGKSAGGHFNPEDKKHGLPPDEDRHAGDLGNLTADADGNATLDLTGR